MSDNHTSDEAYFADTPWCKKLMDDSAFFMIPNPTRQPNPSTEDSFPAETLNTVDTVAAWLTLARKPASPDDAIKEVRILMSLGSGLNGPANVLHGGVSATLMDEAIAVLSCSNKSRSDCPAAYAGNLLTAHLNVDFVKPVTTPQIVLVMAVYRKIEGRKVFMDLAMKDGNGVMLAAAQSLAISSNSTRVKL